MKRKETITVGLSTPLVFLETKERVDIYVNIYKHQLEDKL